MTPNTCIACVLAIELIEKSSNLEVTERCGYSKST